MNFNPDPGGPGTTRLPVHGQPGNAFAQGQRMHPAALAAQPRTNPLNSGPSAMAGRK